MSDDYAGAAVVCTAAVSAAGYYIADAVAGHWRKARAADHAAALKRQMLDKGFTADDILRVVTADGPVPEPTTQLSEALAAGKIDGESVGRLMNLLAQVPQPLRAEMTNAVRQMAAAGKGYTGKDLLKYIDARVEGLVEEPVPA